MMFILATPVTLLYAGILGLLYGVLVRRVVAKRRQHRVPRHDGDVPELAARIRAHSNFAEYVPLLLVFLLVLELNDAPLLLLHAFGALLVLARAYHAYGLIVAEFAKDKDYRPRQRATFATVMLMKIASLSFILAYILSWL